MFDAGRPTPPKRPTGGLQARVELGDLRSSTVRGPRPAHSRENRPSSESQVDADAD